MRALVNIRHLEAHSVELEGELPLEELDADPMDELIHLEKPLQYALEVQLVEGAILARGALELELSCECSRCLKPYTHKLQLDDWAVHLPLVGDDQVPVNNDQVDLTPYIREDIVLAFPQQPLCEQECKGLSRPPEAIEEHGRRESDETSSAWAELNKLKL